MSRTRIQTKRIMENNNSNSFSLLSGFNACSFNDTNASYQLFLNKSLENEKLNGVYGTNDILETNDSLLKTLNNIDSTIKNVYPTKSETYTLEDLLDFENDDLSQPSLFAGNLDDEIFLPNDVSMETALASPLSSSSDESCDLDEILFFDDSTTNAGPSEITTTTPVVVEESLPEPPSDHQYAMTPVQEPQMSLEDLLNSSGTDLNDALSSLNSDGTDLSALCSLLFQQQQNQGDAESTTEVIEEVQSPAPLSPASSTSSESDSETRNAARYQPYKRKQKTPEQKLRKKAQNRTAATRYRIKKKDELKSMTDEADQLEEKNKELKGKVEGLRNEIDYLKNLMLDVIKARLSKGATPDALLSAAALMLK